MENKKKGPQGIPVEVNPLGSLGLLALGYRGVQAWRVARKEAIEKAKAGGTNEQKKD